MRLRVHAERLVDVPAGRVYRLIADYENHHWRFLPPAATDFGVEEGGVGAGTVLHVTFKLAGQSQTYRMRVEEPEPGRVLTETEIDGPTVTTYMVEPQGAGSRVHLETEWEPADGLAGLVDRLLGPLLVRRLYNDLLDRLAEYARSQSG